MPAVPNALVAFVAEHQRCGDLDGGLDNGYVWLQCSCGGLIMHPAVSRQRHPRPPEHYHSPRTARVEGRRALVLERQQHKPQSIAIRSHPALELRAAATRQQESIARLGVWPKVNQHVCTLLVREDEDE